MKLLLLGTSQESEHWTEGQPRTQHFLRDMLAAEYGEPAEVVTRTPWPNHRLPGFVQQWVAETDPDTILFVVNDFAFAYPSTPRRVRRLLGERIGGALLAASLRLADSKRLAHNGPFRTIRWLGQALIGGDFAIPTDEAIENISQAIRVLARRENTLLVVIGPRGWARWGVTRRQSNAAERQRLRAHSALQNLCQSLHITYIGDTVPLWMNPSTNPTAATKTNTVGDNLHLTSAGAEAVARGDFDAIKTGMDAHATA